MAAAYGAVPTAQGLPNPNNDLELTSPPSDGVSALAWSPKANLLVASSWDKQVRCWEVASNGQSVAKAAISHEQPVLCCAWNADGTAVFSAGCDNQAKMWDLATNQSRQVAAHDAPIRCLAWIPEMNALVTGSWDKTLRYWDLRQATAVATVQLPDRCYTLSAIHPVLVVGCAERHMAIYNLQAPQTLFKSLQSPLKYQTRCVATFPDRTGYLVGSIEGRVAVQHVDESPASVAKNFTFKCHREGSEIYAVNAIAFHPQHGTFVTAGSDGAYNFWDKDSKQRLKAMARCNQPIPCCAFNHDGSILAYGVSYDWSRGSENYNPAAAQNYVLLHATQEAEVKARARPATAKR